MKNKIIILVLALFLLLSKNISATQSSEMILIKSGTTSLSNGSISINNNFYISKYEVTQSKFETIMGFNPSKITINSDKKPVNKITWYDAIMYANKLSEVEGINKYYKISEIEYRGNNIINAHVSENKKSGGYRLPSSKEWEYAARGGENGKPTVYSGSNNLDEVGWFWRNSGDEWLDGERKWDKIVKNNNSSHLVGTKESNELGLYDMTGNLDEWTNSLSKTRKGSFIIKGGCWGESEIQSSISYTYANQPWSEHMRIGFRVARNHYEPWQSFIKFIGF